MTTAGTPHSTALLAVAALCAATTFISCSTIDSAMGPVASIVADPREDRPAARTATVAAEGSIVSLIDDPLAPRIVALARETPALAAASASSLATRRAASGAAWSGLLPDVAANAGFDRNNQGIDALDGTRRTETTYTVGVTAGVTPDLWGTATNALRAARARADAEALAVLRSREVAAVQALTVYVQLAAATTTRSIHDERVRILTEIEILVDERQFRGTAGADDLASARSALYAAGADAAGAATDTDVLRLELESLLGDGARELRDELSQAITVPAVALPHAGTGDTDASQGERLDLIAADLQARAARYAAYSAVTEGLPSVRLEATTFRSGTDFDRVLDARTNWNVVGTVTVPLFEGGNRSAQALAAFSAAEALEREREAIYRGARIERERAASLDAGYTAQLYHLARARAEAAATVDAYRRRYQDGTIDIETLLTAQEQAVALGRQLVALEAAQAINRITLALALGVPVTSANVAEKSSTRLEENS